MKSVLVHHYVMNYLLTILKRKILIWFNLAKNDDNHVEQIKTTKNNEIVDIVYIYFFLIFL